MKRFKGLQFILGVVVGAIVFGGSAAIAAGIVAKPKTAEVVIDGKAVDLKGYIIEGRHYFQLRDLDAALAPGGKDFGIVWDGKNNRVIIDTTKPYMTESDNAQMHPDAPGNASTDYSRQANQEIFASFFTPEMYNTDRQRVIDTGTTVNWGTKYTPQGMEAVEAASTFFDSIAQLPELDKAKRINDFLCAHMMYNSTAAFLVDEFWTGTTNGVCEEYASMFQYMCWRAKLPCVYISGITDANDHAWNEVYINGKWLFYDGNLSDIRQSIAIGEEAKNGHVYTERNTRLTIYQKEVYAPSSTM